MLIVSSSLITEIPSLVPIQIFPLESSIISFILLPIIFLFSEVYGVKIPFWYTVIPESFPIQTLLLESVKTTLLFCSLISPSFFVNLKKLRPLYFVTPPHVEVIQMFPDLSSLKSVTMSPEIPSFSEY
jgi:hypothetical protein